MPQTKRAARAIAVPLPIPKKPAPKGLPPINQVCEDLSATFTIDESNGFFGLVRPDAAVMYLVYPDCITDDEGCLDYEKIRFEPTKIQFAVEFLRSVQSVAQAIVNETAAAELKILRRKQLKAESDAHH